MYHFTVRMAFLIGILIGAILAICFIKTKQQQYTKSISKRSHEYEKYNKWLRGNNVERLNVSIDAIRYGKQNFTTESEFLYNKVQILCLILVKKKTHIEAAKNTWAKGCNNIVEVQLDVEKHVPGKRTKENSKWVLLCKAIQGLPKNYHWVLIVNDLTYVIMENLRLLLAPIDFNEGHYLGHAVTFWNTMYNSGRAGYVISQRSLNRLSETLSNDESCLADTSFLNQEDFYLGKHLSNLKIYPVDTRDSSGLSRFHIYNWNQEFFPGLNYHKTSVFPVVCCSIHSISFKAVDAEKMYSFQFIFYHLQIFLKGTLGNVIPKPMPKDIVWKSFLKEQGIQNENISSREYFNLWTRIGYDLEVLRHQSEGKEDY